MAKYRVPVIEVRHVFRVYVVEAKNAEAAERKAVSGDTLAEEDRGGYEVANRELDFSRETERSS